MDIPTLSVILPNYNHAKYIGGALEAILSQPFKSIEIIVIDDCSTDNSVEIIKTYAKQHDNIKLLINEKNMGTVFTLKRGLTIARGDYVHFTASDDKILPELYLKSMDLLMRYPEAGVCVLDYYCIPTVTGKMLNYCKHNLGKEAGYVSPEEFKRFLKKKSIYSLATNGIYKKSACLEAGGLISALEWHSDWFVGHVVAFRNGFCYVPEFLQVVRHNPASYHYSGRKKWSKQSKVLKQMLTLLDSAKYKDVRSAFKIPSLLAQFNPYLCYVIFGSPRNWHLLSFSYIKSAIQNYLYNQKFIRMIVKRINRIKV